MYRGSKYPSRYKTCNDTCTAFGMLCCKKTDQLLEDDVLRTKEQEARNHFLWQKTVDKAVENLNGNWSWASAGLLFTACTSTISLIDSSKTELIANWVYFVVIFLVGVLFSLIEHSLESPEVIAQELELKVPQKKAALGDKKMMKKESEMIQKATLIPINDDDAENVIQRLLKFVQVEVC